MNARALKSWLAIAGWVLAGLIVGCIVLGSLILGSGLAEIAGADLWLGELGLVLVVAALAFLVGRTIAKNSPREPLAHAGLFAGVFVVPLVLGLRGFWVTGLEILGAAAVVLLCGFLGQRSVKREQALQPRGPDASV